MEDHPRTTVEEPRDEARPADDAAPEETPVVSEPVTDEAAPAGDAVADEVEAGTTEEAGPEQAEAPFPDEPAPETPIEAGGGVAEDLAVSAGELTGDDGEIAEPEELAAAAAPESPPADAVSKPEPEPEPAAEPEAIPSEAPAEPPPPRADDPFGPPGDWYVIHTYAGYENKVKTNLGSRIQTMQMQDKIFDVVIPMEDVMEIKGGKKQVVQKKVFPGYLLVKMVYDDDSWYVVRNTPGVTGFVSSGTGQKPTPLSRREVEKILAVKKEEAKPQFRLEFEEDDVVRIISGPFADFTGTISEINVDQSKVKVMVNIFDRETPVELGFDQVTKA